MLVELRLRGLGAIDEATLELGPGFTAITGETGAGKTMLLTGLALLLGGRGDAALVRAGHARAEVEGRFRVDPDGCGRGAVEQCGRRARRRRGARSPAPSAPTAAPGPILGGRIVPVATLASLADDLVTVHGQADQRGLLRPGGAAGGARRVRRRPARERAGGLPGRLRRSSRRCGPSSRTSRTTAASAPSRPTGCGTAWPTSTTSRPSAGEDVALAAEAARLGHVEALRGGGDHAPMSR